MKKSESLKLGLVHEHLHQVLHVEKELVEVTFHYGMYNKQNHQYSFLDRKAKNILRFKDVLNRT